MNDEAYITLKNYYAVYHMNTVAFCVQTNSELC